MSARTTRLSVLVLGGFLAAGALMSSPANAAPRSNDGVFCQAIGLSMDQRQACVNELANANGRDARDAVRASWVSRSALGARDLDTGSLYVPAVDNNLLNGMPGTPYQDKPHFVSNKVAADIRRALRADHLDRMEDTAF